MPGRPCMCVSMIAGPPVRRPPGRSKACFDIAFPSLVLVSRGPGSVASMGEAKPSAVLIVNPTAGRMSDSARHDVVAALRERCRLEVFWTEARDEAITIARGAAEMGVKLVIAFGGDGHVNEVANGVAGTPSRLAVIPGGTMNVFARAVGIPLDSREAIHHLLEAHGRPARRVPLGRIDDRYFTFSAGCGFDAEAAELVDSHLSQKHRFGELFFYWSAFRVLAGSYRHRRPFMRLKGTFGEVPVSMAIACNTGPYAYFAGRPLNLTPKVRLEGGLDVFALGGMRIEALPLYMWRVAVSRSFDGDANVVYETDLEDFLLEADQPFKRHVDGEPLPPARTARFSIAKDVLKVNV
jgi:diacylglycerol kinase family enzyme